MKLPLGDLRKQFALKCGGGFRMRYSFGTEPEGRPKPRFFFVLNLDPRADQVVILYTTTTNIQGRKSQRPPEVLVEIKRGEYGELPEDSIIDCESPLQLDRAKLEAKLASGEAEPLMTQLPAPILQRIREAIAVSKTLAPDLKRLILADDRLSSNADTPA